MGNSNFKELSNKDSSLIDYQRVTLTVTPNGTLPEGMIISVTGSSPLGNWDLKKTRELQYSSGTYTLSFIIPTCLKGSLSFAFVLQNEDGSTICHERGPRRKLPATDVQDTVGAVCGFSVPAGGKDHLAKVAGSKPVSCNLSCLVLVEVSSTDSFQLGSLSKGSEKDYFQMQKKSQTTPVATIPVVDSDSSLQLSSPHLNPSGGTPLRGHTRNISSGISWKEFVMDNVGMESQMSLDTLAGPSDDLLEGMERDGGQSTSSSAGPQNMREETDSSGRIIRHYTADGVLLPLRNPDKAEQECNSYAAAQARRRLALVLVGLPARGKTFTSQKLTRYLRWMGFSTKHFNVGSYRRKVSGAAVGANFFDAGNSDAAQARELAAKLCMEDMLQWMEGGGQVGIYDATNTTRKRREWLAEMARGRCKLIFIETISNDPRLINQNIKEKVEHSSDYMGVPLDEATADFKRRIKEYERVYEPVGTESSPTRPGGKGSYIKLIDIASGSGHMQINRIQGYLPGRIVSFLVNTTLHRCPIYIARHGESTDNALGRMGGDASLSAGGDEFARNLAAYIKSLPLNLRPQSVWISMLKRSAETAKYLHDIPKVVWRQLNEIDMGVCDGMTYSEIKAAMPAEFEMRAKDKLRFRYSRGESYLDVIQRLESLIIELERQQQPVLIVAHQGVVRCLYSYFVEKPQEEIPHIPMELHEVKCLKPSAYGTGDEDIFLGPKIQMDAEGVLPETS